jgi:hypothetical protein
MMDEQNKDNDGIDEMLREVLGSNGPGEMPGLMDKDFLARCKSADKDTLVRIIEVLRDDINSLGICCGISLSAFTIISEALNNADTTGFSKQVMHDLTTAGQMAEEVYAKSQDLHTITIHIATIPVQPDDRRSPEQIIDDFLEDNNE